MSKKPIVIFGSGGHAKVVIDLVERAGNYRIVAVIDPKTRQSKLYRYPIQKQIPAKVLRGIVAIGDNWKRQEVVREILKKYSRFEFVSAIHPNASVGKNVALGVGTVVMAGACINSDSQIGNHVILNTGSIVEHDCQLGNFTSFATGATLGGGCTVDEGSALGLRCSLIHSIQIGKHTVIGAGANVTQNIPAWVVAYGNPCRVIRKRSEGDSYL